MYFGIDDFLNDAGVVGGYDEGLSGFFQAGQEVFQPGKAVGVKVAFGLIHGPNLGIHGQDGA
mgnify:CR=1 FL=1